MREPGYYRDKAARFRELASDSDTVTAAALNGLAADYEAVAHRLDPSFLPPIRLVE